MELVAFMKEKLRLTAGCGLGCNKCRFNIDDKLTCNQLILYEPEKAEEILKNWLEEEEKVDWSTVPVDTLIEVNTGNYHWHRRYFAECYKGTVRTWFGGATSQTTIQKEEWQYARLIKEEE